MASAADAATANAALPSEKPIEKRLSECMTILQKLTHDLAIPYDSPEVQELKTHMDAYIKHGTCWSGSVSFLRFGRIAEVVFPRGAHAAVEVTLRIPNHLRHRQQRRN
jgi:hypothetical protein